MDFCIIALEEKNKIDFIGYWSSICAKFNYEPSDEDYYWPNIGIDGKNLLKLTEKNIKCLLFWKNGGYNRWKKRIPIVKKSVANLDKINEFREKKSVLWEDFLDFYNNTIKKCTTGRIYGTFIAHIAKPFEFPILDQHVVRAQIFITKKRKIIENTSEEIIKKKSLSNFLDFCYKPYRNFFNGLIEDTEISFREIDRALWMFGKYLKNKLKLKYLIE